MVLQERMGGKPPMLAPQPEVVGPAPPEDPGASGLNTFTVEFFTENRIMQADVATTEFRLLDYLNSSTPTLDISHFEDEFVPDGRPSQFGINWGQVTKSKLLVVIPLQEPVRPEGTTNLAWKKTKTRRCRVGLGPYIIDGMFHAEVGRDPRTTLRLLEMQFMPLTEATIRYSDGRSNDHGAVIINRHRLDFVALEHWY